MFSEERSQNDLKDKKDFCQKSLGHTAVAFSDDGAKGGKKKSLKGVGKCSDLISSASCFVI